MEVLSLKNISKSFKTNQYNFFKKAKRKTVLKNISFSAKKGDSIAIVGKNGCGKTTLLKIIAGVLQQDNGLMRSIYSSDEISIVNANDRSFFWRLSVLENLKFFLPKK